MASRYSHASTATTALVSRGPGAISRRYYDPDPSRGSAGGGGGDSNYGSDEGSSVCSKCVAEDAERYWDSVVSQSRSPSQAAHAASAAPLPRSPVDSGSWARRRDGGSVGSSFLQRSSHPGAPGPDDDFDASAAPLPPDYIIPPPPNPPPPPPASNSSAGQLGRPRGGRPPSPHLSSSAVPGGAPPPPPQPRDGGAHEDWRDMALALKSTVEAESVRHDQLLGKLDVLIDLYTQREVRDEERDAGRAPHAQQPPAAALPHRRREEEDALLPPPPPQLLQEQYQQERHRANRDTQPQQQQQQLHRCDSRSLRTVSPPRSATPDELPVQELLQQPPPLPQPRQAATRTRAAAAPRNSSRSRSAARSGSGSGSGSGRSGSVVYRVAAPGERLDRVGGGYSRSGSAQLPVSRLRGGGEAGAGAADYSGTLRLIEELEAQVHGLQADTQTLQVERDYLSGENGVYRRRLQDADAAFGHLRHLQAAVSTLDSLGRKESDVLDRRAATLRGMRAAAANIEDKLGRPSPVIKQCFHPARAMPQRRRTTAFS